MIRRSETALYYLIPLIMLAFVAVSWRLRPEVRVNAALTVTAVGFALFAAEIAMFATRQGHYGVRVEFVRRRIAAARAAGVRYDDRNQLEVVTDLNDQGVPAVARVHPAALLPTGGVVAEGDRIFPVAGISRRPTVTCNETGSWALIQTDEHGFQNPAGQYGFETFDVVLVGDSYGFGECMEQGHGPDAALRRSRTVLNLSFGGNGPLLELAALREFGERYEPGVVLWVYYEGNDLRDLRGESQSDILLEYLDPGYAQGLSERQAEVDSLLLAHHTRLRERARNNASRRWRCLPILCGVRNLWVRQPEARFATDLPLGLFGEVLETARSRTRSWGGEFVFVYLPAWWRYSMDVDADALHDRRQLMEMLEALDVPVVDFAGFLETHPDPLSFWPFRERGHFNAAGYSTLSGYIDQRLEELAR